MKKYLNYGHVGSSRVFVIEGPLQRLFAPHVLSATHSLEQLLGTTMA